MKEEFYRIRIYKAPFPVTFKGEECSRFKVFWEGVYKDALGRQFSRIWHCKTYNSIEDMEADFGGFMQFIEYAEEIDMEAEYDKTKL